MIKQRVSPGSVAVADFEVQVDRDADAVNYQLGCEIVCSERSTVIPLAVSVSPAGILGSWMAQAFAVLMIITLGAAITAKKFNLFRWNRRRRRTK